MHQRVAVKKLLRKPKLAIKKEGSYIFGVILMEWRRISDRIYILGRYSTKHLLLTTYNVHLNKRIKSQTLTIRLMRNACHTCK